MTSMAPQFAYILNRKLQPDNNVLRIHIQHVMKGSHASKEATPRRKPRLQDGTVTVDTDKYRLVGIPPSSREPRTRCRIDKDSLSTSNATMIGNQRVAKCDCI